MDGSKLSISALKDKISSKLSSGEPSGASKGHDGKSTGGSKKAKGAKSEKQTSTSKTGVTGKKDKKDKKSRKEKSGKSEKNDTQDQALDNDEVDILRREALALGATEEDLKLVEGVDNEIEQISVDCPEGVDNNFNSDLSKFMNGLGFSGQVDVVEEEEEETQLIDKGKERKAEKDSEEIEGLVAQKKEPKKKEQKTKKVKLEPIVIEKKEESTVLVAEMAKEKKDKRQSDKINNVQSVNSEKLLIECRIDWYNIETPAIEEPEKLDRFALERLTEKAKALIDSENKTYLTEFTSNNSQRKFLSQILSDGTLNDKISALTLLVQEAPLHNLKAFDTLLSYCEKKSRTASLQAINALKDLFLNGLLPDRKLLSFPKQKLNKNADVITLALHYYEDHLKKSYFKFIQVLEFLSHDPILHVRMNVVLHIFDLLKAKPEQEANLLRLGVNKLGDVENKVAAKTSYQILQLEETHPAMKKIVTDSVTDMVLQKNHDYHSQYYTILTLNQTILLRGDTDLANSLVKTYFSLFEKILIESDPALKDAAEDKVLGKSERGRKNNRKAFKKGKKGGKSVKKEEKSEEEVVEERSAKMFSALLTGLNRAFPFSDLPSEIYSNHLNTLYKITHSTNFNTSVQALVLVQQIISQQDLDSSRFYRTLYESLMDPRLVNSSKQGIYLNLLFKSLKNDIQNIPRVLAFVKRILQICCHWVNVGAITGMFYLLMELSKTHPQILELMEAEGARPENLTSDSNVDTKVDDSEYDPKKRDPEYANAQKSSMWEIALFMNHYHPSVSIYATSLVEGKPQVKPDLGLFLLAHFLDRFVYKNAKQKSNLKGSSIMQPLGGGHLGSLLVRATNVKSSDIPVNTIDWLSKKAELVRPDEKFFYDYFTRNEKKIRGKKSRDENDEDEEFGEEEVWDALVKLKPDVEGSDDAGFSDFDEADFADMSDLDENADGAADDFENFEDAGEFPEDSDVAEDSDEGAFSALQNDEDEVSDGEFSLNEDEELNNSDQSIDAGTEKKRKLDGEHKKKKKTKLLALPTFASAEDYAQYLGSDDEM
ncbi:CBF-domain-containing protein [Metschnikowia bicuspidata var. bicuspidata NRRL YB-4993]|uniref:CBF-domain-containing protein n=1 Tax=Metschnikowia bicuspidata var. bicuspidata NRRL YB-4993 TaxID=869754 RepID=A0A1A0HHR2_9ASCO|nr:CBF-domain-containing protein [Metschnikowia bicuspidata var. bicuspidata NRRL YB-4993]OBA23383.1 CBF-domain-containing protein [Metschnikowia bicuspidata var. bicuspidata NRRL YB-4993]